MFFLPFHVAYLSHCQCLCDAAEIHDGIFPTQTQQLFRAWGSKLEQRYGWLFGLHVWLHRIPALQKQYGNNNRHCCFRFSMRRNRWNGRTWLNFRLPPFLQLTFRRLPCTHNRNSECYISTCISLHTMVDLAWVETVHWFWCAQIQMVCSLSYARFALWTIVFDAHSSSSSRSKCIVHVR